MPKKTKIILAMDNGCIEVIDKPKDLEIEVRDYDDLEDAKNIKKDDKGRKYYSYVVLRESI